MAEYPTRSLYEILGEDGCKELQDFCIEVNEGKHYSNVRLAMKEKILVPRAAKLTAEWDLDYLSYAICYKLQLPL
jgi:hypothetical protein